MQVIFTKADMCQCSCFIRYTNYTLGAKFDILKIFHVVNYFFLTHFSKINSEIFLGRLF